MNISRYLKIGLFFISIGTAGTIYVVRSTDGFNDLNTKVYEVVIDDATGLSTNSKVYLAGVPVGKIRSIDLSGGQAVLRVAFLKNVEIRQDASIARKPSSILGTSILALTPGTEMSPILGPGGRLEAVRGSGDTSAILKSAQDLTLQVSEMLREFQSRQLELLASTLEAINSITQKLNERSDAELVRISRILEASASITERIDRLIQERQSDLSLTAQEVHLAVENIRKMTEEIRSGEGTLGKVLYDDTLYTNLVSVAERAAAAAQQLEEAIASYTTLAVTTNSVMEAAVPVVRKAAGLGFQVDSTVRYNILSSSFQAGASLRLEPLSRDRYYRIGVSSRPQGSQTSYTVDAEIARQFNIYRLRGGLYEGTAGLGFDILPASSFLVSTEVFNFTQNAFPNLRGSLTWFPVFDPASNKPWNWLYVYAGVNDVLNPQRDVFLGLGLRFADEEVRGLVGLVPFAGK
ncbi:MAG: MlaD family protein [Termitinemataceae bacterium]